MNIIVRPARLDDLEILAKADGHVPREKMEKLISGGFVLVAMRGECFCGVASVRLVLGRDTVYEYAVRA